MNVEEQRIYRALAGGISQDNPCIQFSSKEAWQSDDEPNQMQLFVDSEWAGCACVEAVDFWRTLEAWNAHPENMVLHTGSCGRCRRRRPSCMP